MPGYRNRIRRALSQLMTQRETWLTDSRSIEQNRMATLAGLLVSEPQVLRAGAEPRAGRRRSWLASLGSLAASTGQQGVGWS